jgi:hypothetical protein
MMATKDFMHHHHPSTITLWKAHNTNRSEIDDLIEKSLNHQNGNPIHIYDFTGGAVTMLRIRAMDLPGSIRCPYLQPPISEERQPCRRWRG